MKHRYYAATGFLAIVMFWTTYFIMAAQRPEYSFLYKAISELGTLDAPNKWMWNVFGYILPGGLIAVYSIGLYKAVATEKASKLPLIGIFLSGLLMSVAGIFPADMDNRSSLTTVLHMVGSYGSYIFFLIGAFTYPKVIKTNHYWRSSTLPLLAFVWLTIVFGAWNWVFPDMPSVGQRITFFFYFAWIAYTAVKLYKFPAVRSL